MPVLKWAASFMLMCPVMLGERFSGRSTFDRFVGMFAAEQIYTRNTPPNHQNQSLSHGRTRCSARKHLKVRQMNPNLLSETLVIPANGCGFPAFEN